IATLFAWATGARVNWTHLTPVQWALLLSLGLVCGSLALALYYRARSKIDAHVAASLELVGPIVTALLAIVILGDVLNMYHVLGIVVLLASAYMIVSQRAEGAVVADDTGGPSFGVASVEPPVVREQFAKKPAVQAGLPRAGIGPRPEVRWGLQLKITALSVSLILATMIPASMLMIRHARAVVARQIQNTMVNTAQLIAALPRRDADRRGWQLYERYLDEIVRSRVEADDYTIDFVYIAVRDERDEVRAFAFNDREYELRDVERQGPYRTGDRVAARRLLRQAAAGQLAAKDVIPVVARVGPTDAPTRIVDIGYRRSVSHRPTERIAAVNSAVTLVLILLGVVASMKLSAHLTRPMQELNAAMARVGRGDLEQRVALGSGDEVEVMAWEFNRMVQGLRERLFLRAALQRYVSVQVAEKMIQEGEWWFEPEEREVTVMFSDIRGFTPLSERLTPGEVFAMLNEHFGVMVDIIFAHRGTLDKFIGDCIMAVWGSPHQIPQHPLLAVKAGLAMQEALAELNARRAADGKDPIRMGVGINTGSVYAGSLGLDSESAHRLEYAVIGDDVNLAQRIESQTKPAQVLISQTTYELVKDYVRAQALEPIQVKGKASKVFVYEVLGLREESQGVLEAAGSASGD
ncbi:MAG: adenylate/guanylate cyclase domain-containing protein, partial [Armatimonadota bacterium]